MAEALLTIAEVGARGDGIAWYRGRRVFVRASAPGDRLRVRLGRERGEGIRGTVIERLADGPARAAPPCPHFGVCGGCALQHLADDFVAAWKRERVVTALARRGIGADVAATHTVPAASRRRATLAAHRRGGAAALGFRQAASRRIVDLRRCLILTPGLEALRARLRAHLDDLLEEGEEAVLGLSEVEGALELVLGLPSRVDGARRERLARLARELGLARLAVRDPGSGNIEVIAEFQRITVCLDGINTAVPPGAFRQPTTAGERFLADFVRAATAGARRVADLYAGCGALSFALPPPLQVLAVEGEAASAAALAAAAKGLGGRVRVERRDLARRPLAPDELAGFDAVVLDPPRAGAAEQARALARSAVPTVVAISCNPDTFARDVKILLEGGYGLERIQPVDQFRWSPHVEVAASLRRLRRADP